MKNELNEIELEKISGGTIVSVLPNNVNPDSTVYIRLVLITDENGNLLPNEVPLQWVKYEGTQTLVEITKNIGSCKYKIEYIIV